MHPEHILAGSILVGLLLVACTLVGLFIVRPMFDRTAPAKFKMFPIVLASVFMPLGLVFYYLNKFMEMDTSVQRAVTSVLLPYAVFMVGWISEYIARRRGSGI